MQVSMIVGLLEQYCLLFTFVVTGFLICNKSVDFDNNLIESTQYQISVITVMIYTPDINYFRLGVFFPVRTRSVLCFILKQ